MLCNTIFSLTLLLYTGILIHKTVIEPKIVDIRRASLDDIPLLNKISWVSKQSWGYPDEWMEKWRDDLTVSADTLDTQVVNVLCIENEVKGFCAIEKGYAAHEVNHLWLHPDSMGHGWGKLLLFESLKREIEDENPILVLADPNAELFYRKMGFATFSQKESQPRGRFLPFMRLNSVQCLTT